MTEPNQNERLEMRLRKSCGRGSHPLAVAARRTMAAIEGTVAGVVARLPSGPRYRLLVAISGGPDSVAVLHALKRICRPSRFQLAAAHLNHGIRGPESDRDESFVRDLCGQLDVELVVERAHGLTAANLEERARELRYEFLNRTADALKAQSIVLGHHLDDQAETVLLRLLRGTGITGLAAMAELGPGRLMRPLLSVDRVTILAYLAAIGAGYVVDSSNLEGGASRNRVRARLLPQLARDYSPGIARRLAELASEMRDFDSFIQTEARRSLHQRLISVPGMGQQAFWRMDVQEFESISPALARAILRELIRSAVGDLRRIERVHIESLYRSAAGENPSATVVLPRGWRFRREYHTAVLEYCPTPIARQSATVAECGAVRLMPGANLLNAAGLTLTLQEVDAQQPCFPAAPWHPPSRFEAYFDAAEAPLLTARCFRAGDRIRPLGLRGSRKIHDVLVDYKMPRARRGSWLLVASDDEVVWIPGLVRSRLALVTSESKKVLHLRVDSLPGEPKVRLPGL